MPKKTDMILRCLDYYMDFLRSKQKECKNRGFPKIIDEDIEKKIKDLNDLKGNWIPVEEKKKMDIKYHNLLSDALINYRQDLLRSIGLTKGDIQGLKDPFPQAELELRLIEEFRRMYNMD